MTAPTLITKQQQYEDSARRVIGRYRDLNPRSASQKIPGCPAWTVRDLAGHLPAVARDSLTGNTEGAPGPEWTAAGIARNAEFSIEELMSGWEQDVPAVVRGIEEKNPALAAIDLDVTIHEADLLEALCEPVEMTPDGHGAMFARLVRLLSRRIAKEGAPTVRLTTEFGTWTVGDSEPVASVEVDALTAYRALAGRRSLPSMLAWHWHGDPSNALPALQLFPAGS